MLIWHHKYYPFSISLIELRTVWLRPMQNTLYFIKTQKRKCIEHKQNKAQGHEFQQFNGTRTFGVMQKNGSTATRLFIRILFCDGWRCTCALLDTCTSPIPTMTIFSGTQVKWDLSTIAPKEVLNVSATLCFCFFPFLYWFFSTPSVSVFLLI
jgi:hypothetical protein